jgi:hypothetical protein
MAYRITMTGHTTSTLQEAFIFHWMLQIKHFKYNINMGYTT